MNQLALIFLIACSLLLAPVVIVAQEPKASVEITPDTCLIGDNVFYLLSITHYETQIVLLPSDTDEVAFYPFEIRSRKNSSKKSAMASLPNDGNTRSQFSTQVRKSFRRSTCAMFKSANPIPQKPF